MTSALRPQSRPLTSICIAALLVLSACASTGESDFATGGSPEADPVTTVVAQPADADETADARPTSPEQTPLNSPVVEEVLESAGGEEAVSAVAPEAIADVQTEEQRTIEEPEEVEDLAAAPTEAPPVLQTPQTLPPTSELGSVVAPIVLGSNDTASPATDAVVRIAGGCTGTLIAPDVVLTAGHCFAAHSTPPTPTTPMGGTCDWEVPGTWYEFPNHWWTAPDGPTVEFGVDTTATTLAIEAISYSVPDCADALALRLATPIDPGVAVPAEVVLRSIDTREITAVDAVGYGRIDDEDPSDDNAVREFSNLRQITTLDGTFSTNCGLGLGHLCITDDSGIRRGDSGGAIFLSGTQQLVGITRSAGNVGDDFFSAWTTTWSDSAETPDAPNVSRWLSRVVECSNGRVNGFYGNGATLPLINWWSSGRTENRVTTQPGWNLSNALDTLTIDGEHIVNGSRQEGYSAFGFEGFLRNPVGQTLIDGEVPLFSWWNGERGDNFTTSDPSWGMDLDEIEWDGNGQHIVNGPTREGYTLYRLEGYLADPHMPQPVATVPLFSWWNGERGDNFTTSDQSWGMDLDEIEWDANGQHIVNGPTRAGYTLYRLEGFVSDRTQTVSNYCEL